jgi:dinuclear metal center YbgI/SA1388 family protein
MATIREVASFLDEFAPPDLAEEWDNVGLLVGDPSQPAQRIMTCLTVTSASAAEAIDGRADLIVAHHPLPFRAVKRLTAESTAGRILLDLISAHIGIYSPHTAFDSAARGINQRLAEGLGLQDIRPLVPNQQGTGSGRCGRFAEPMSLFDFAERVKRFVSVERVQMVGNSSQSVHSIAVACGAAGEFLEPARDAGCDGMLIGETRFHTLLEAESHGIGLVLPGHFASERFALENLATVLQEQFPNTDVWASREERDPIQWV